MIELKNDALVFSFPEIHSRARLRIHFQRTLRIPDDGKTYPLPPGLGNFPLRHTDDFAQRAPQAWLRRGGVMMPMYQSEALWLNFQSNTIEHHWAEYPFVIKIATGKINAVTGEGWSDGINQKPQDYLVVPTQPWLDGYCVEKGLIRQFVAMPLGTGYTTEEQLTGAAGYGGIQIIVYPMKRKVFERLFPPRKREELVYHSQCLMAEAAVAGADMGLAPGGRMRQEIYDDEFGIEAWDLNHPSRCFVHLCNSMVWRAITCEDPPTVPFTAKEYNSFGLPWFDYYDGDAKALEGADKLSDLKSVDEMARDKGEPALPENETITPEKIVVLRKRLRRNQVREAAF
jgi:hypothetical protein